MPDQPLYQGARLNIAGSTPRPIETPDLTSQAASRASANAAAGLEGIINDFVKIKDFGTSQQQETRLREINAGFEAEADRRMALAPGHEQSLFDENGILIPSAIDDLVHEYSSQINDLPGAYINPETGLHASSIRQSVADNLRSNLFNIATKKQIQTSRSAFEDNLAKAETLKDYDGMHLSIESALRSGIISSARANAMHYKTSQKAMKAGLEKTIAKSPADAYEAIDSGYYDSMDLTELAHYKHSLETQLSRYCEPVTITESERRAATNGLPVKPKFKVRNGATADEYKWRKYYNEHGTYAPFAQDIRNAWEEELANAPVPKNDTERKQWEDNFLKKYCDQDTGYGCDINELQLRAKDKMDELQGLVDLNNRINLDTMLEAIPDDQIASDVTSWYRGSEYNNAQIAKRRNSVKSQLGTLMASWRSTHPKATYDQELTQASQFIKRIVKTESENNDMDPEKEAKDLVNSLEGKDLRTKTDTTGQDSRHRAWQESQHAYTPPPDKQFLYSSPFDEPIAPIPGSREGIYVPQAFYEQLKKQYGENPFVDVTLGNKANVRIPVLGGYEGEDIGAKMTMSARRRLASFEPGRARLRFYKGEETKSSSKENSTASPQASIFGESSVSPEVLKARAGKNLSGYVDDFIEAGNVYGIKPEALLAIAQHETGNGTSSAFRNKNNAMGVSGNGSPRTFDSVRDSIFYMARQLKTNQAYKGKYTIADIGKAYAPVGAANDPYSLNGDWINGVSSFYNNLIR